MSTFLTEENATKTYTAQLVDENDTPVPGSDLNAITVTLYDEDSGDIINARNQSTSGLTVDSAGVLTWLMTADDNPIVNDQHFEEKHRALFEYSWQSGNRNSQHEVTIRVRNFEKV